jgi:hypothetical protein
MIEMYLVAMDQLAREDIAAAAAAHRELGRDYDGAVAEGLIERIGAEIDKRVDAKLGQRSDNPARLGRTGQVSPIAHSSWEAIALALGSMTIGGITAASLLSGGNGSGGVVVLIWIVIGVINVAYSRRR